MSYFTEIASIGDFTFLTMNIRFSSTKKNANIFYAVILFDITKTMDELNLLPSKCRNHS